MEEVVGSIPTRSTNSLNDLDRAGAFSVAICVAVCVVTLVLALTARVSIALRSASVRTWLYRSNMRRLT